MAHEDNPQPDYDTLLKLYGESMLRIEHLKARVAALSNGRRPASDATPDSPQAPAGAEPAEKVKALHGLKAGPPGGAEDTSTDPPPVSRDPRSDEIAQMRLQLASLAGQLDQARQEVREYRARRRRRSRSAERTSWWQSLARRLRMSRPARP